MSSILDDKDLCSKSFFPRKSHSTSKGKHTVPVNENLKVTCYYEKCEQGGGWSGFLWNMIGLAPSPKTILYFHGNGEIVDDYLTSKFKEGLLNAGFNVFLAEYRGYGDSEGTPAYTAMFSDLPFIRDYLVNTLGILERDIIVYGRSIGGVFATEFATQFPAVNSLVLECAYANPTELILRRLPAELIEKFSREAIVEAINTHLDNSSKLSRISPSLPVLILHAADDDLIVPDHANKNYTQCASTQKKLMMYPIGRHNFFHASNSEDYDFKGTKFKSIFEEVKSISHIRSK